MLLCHMPSPCIAWRMPFHSELIPCEHLRAGLRSELHLLQQCIVLGPAAWTMTAVLPALQLHFSQQNEDMQSLQTQRTELTEQLAAMEKALEDRRAEVSRPARLGAPCGLRQEHAKIPVCDCLSHLVPAPPDRRNSQAFCIDLAAKICRLLLAVQVRPSTHRLLVARHLHSPR